MLKAMLTTVDGPEYVRLPALVQRSSVNEHTNTPSNAEDDIDDKDLYFTTKTVNRGDLHNMYGNTVGQPDNINLSMRALKIRLQRMNYPSMIILKMLLQGTGIME